MNKRRKVKEILRANPDGKIVNFGFLMVGFIANRQVLASREVLLLLGARITQDKPGDWFYYDESLLVRAERNDYRLFTAKRSDLVEVGNYLHRYKKFPVKKQGTFNKTVLFTWGVDDVLPEETRPPHRHTVYQRTPPPVKRSLIRRWMDILFSKGKNNEHA